ncbi:PTS beta-glucoside transporter subunit IIABC [Enterococcus canis]|uniref:PTS system sucrose-specific EIIBCA component n=2 Tax=Enterococcus canis TaxID=214095 RepID=A0A1L8RFA5_9ENTE|nr:PTS beta-glucoside transporter subunit IIABC [Enterococcus canis]
MEGEFIMGKYEELAGKVIENVGGKENVADLTHCVTRLRFILKDEQKANDEAIRQMDGVVTLMKSGGQYQVVIGNHVPDVYAEVTNMIGAISSDDAPKQKQSFGSMVVDFISAMMGPVLAVLIGSGMIKGILALFAFSGLIDPASGLYTLLNGTGDAMFMFFPVMLGYTSAKKLKIDPFVGAVIGAVLMYPALQNVDLNILGYNINVAYGSTVMPVVFTTIFASFIYKPLMKVIPDVVKTFMVPMITIAISAPLGFVLIGPVMNGLSSLLVGGVMAIYSFSPILAGFLMGSLWQVIVVFGLHMGFVAVGIVQLASGQATSIFALATGAGYAQTAVVMAIWMKTKNRKLKDLALPAWISGWFGVTEPAIYGVTLPRMKYFVAACISAGFAGAFMGMQGMLVHQMAGLGIFGIPGYFNEAMPISQVLINFGISLAISMIPTFLFTYFTFKDEVAVEDVETKMEQAALKDVVASPIKGKVMPLSSIKDEAFALGALGKGIVIVPEEGKVHAPVDGTVTMVFPTEHAIGVTADNGLQILIHVGMDTVQLEGEGFKARVAQGQKVKKGELMLDFDIDFITSKGYSVETPVVITNSQDILDVIETDNREVGVTDDLLTALF